MSEPLLVRDITLRFKKRYLLGFMGKKLISGSFFEFAYPSFELFRERKRGFLSSFGNLFRKQVF